MIILLCTLVYFVHLIFKKTHSSTDAKLVGGVKSNSKFYTFKSHLPGSDQPLGVGQQPSTWRLGLRQSWGELGSCRRSYQKFECQSCFLPAPSIPGISKSWYWSERFLSPILWCSAMQWLRHLYALHSSNRRTADGRRKSCNCYKTFSCQMKEKMDKST